jgi:hypothetical protein
MRMVSRLKIGIIDQVLTPFLCRGYEVSSSWEKVRLSVARFITPKELLRDPRSAQDQPARTTKTAPKLDFLDLIMRASAGRCLLPRTVPQVTTVEGISYGASDMQVDQPARKEETSRDRRQCSRDRDPPVRSLEPSASQNFYSAQSTLSASSHNIRPVVLLHNCMQTMPFCFFTNFRFRAPELPG